MSFTTDATVSIGRQVPSLSPECAPDREMCSRNDVHLWTGRLDLPDVTVRRLEQLLSDDEAERALEFRFDRDRRRYTVGRGLLREVLSRYSGISPASLRFAYGPTGKPTLGAGPWDSRWRFSVSHSDDLILFAIAYGRDLGVDIEKVRQVPEWQALMELLFSAEERDIVAALPHKQQECTFLRCWTRREAYLKATGEGLRGVVRTVPAADLRTMESRLSPMQSIYKLFDLDLDAGCVGSLAVHGDRASISSWRIADEWAAGNPEPSEMGG
jgi:4'-phosphopantetheinyl transferase